MPQPTLSDVHVNALLTNFSLMFAQEAKAFVADRVFPIVPVQKESDRYLRYNRGDFNRNLMKKRAPGAESAGSGYRIDNTPTYTTDDWSLHHDIPDRIRANADVPLNLDVESTKWLVTQSLINKEVNFATNFFSSGLWTTQWTGEASSPGSNQFLQWNDPSSTPIEDVRHVKQLVQLAGGGFRPNTLVLGRPVFDRLVDHPDLVDRIKYTGTSPQPAEITLQSLAAIFELDRVLVMDSIQNTALEQQAPSTFSADETNVFIGGDNALLVYTPAAPTIMSPAAGLTFACTSLFGNNSQGNRIKSFYMPWLESTRVEIDANYAQVLTAPDLGGFFVSAVAS